MKTQAVYFSAFVLLIWILSLSAQEFYREDGAKSFCKYAPLEYQLNDHTAQCPKVKLFARPLREIKACCELNPPGKERVTCLDKLRRKELDVTRLYLNWREGPERDEMYLKYLKKCSPSSGVTKRGVDFGSWAGEDLGCDDLKGRQCLDPAADFEQYCRQTGFESGECNHIFQQAVKTKAFNKICIDNVDKNLVSALRPEQKTIHFKCYREQAMDIQFSWTLGIQETMQSDCFSKKYGSDVDINYVRMKELMTYTFGEEIWKSNKKMYEGLLDHIEQGAEPFLEEVCEKEKNYYDARECPRTPITESLLSYKSVKNLNKEVEGCCKGLKPPLKADKKEQLITCLKNKDLYGQFLEFGSQYFRDMYRNNSIKTWVCVSQSLFDEGGYQRGYPQMNAFQLQHLGYYDNAEGKDLENMMKLNVTMRPEQFLFFLRGFKTELFSQHEFYEAACDACALGEKLGLKAYVYPALMCPALVSEALYEPVRLDPVCPDLLFYKFQVAHYCCLDSVLETYNLGSNYNPNNCANNL